MIPDTDEAKELVKRLKNGERSKTLLRQVQQYTVNVYDANFRALCGMGSIEPLDEEISVLTDMGKYDPHTELDAKADSGVGIFI